MDSPDLIDDVVDFHAEGNKAFVRMVLAIIVSTLLLVGLVSFITWGVLNLHDPIPHEWIIETLSEYPEPALSSFSASAINHHLIYLVGGHLDDPSIFEESSFSNVTHVYNISSNSWSYAASTPLPIQDHVLKTYKNQLYAFGGLTYDVSNNPTYRALDSVFRYDPNSNSWTHVITLPRPRWSHGVGLLGNMAFIIGGWANPDTWYTVIDVCDLDNLTCHETDWNIPRFQRAFSLVEANGGDDFIMVGGYGKMSNEPFTQVLLFNPASGAMSNVKYPALPFHDVQPALGVSVDNLFVFGGFYSTDPNSPSEYRSTIYYCPTSGADEWYSMDDVTLTAPKAHAVVVPLAEQTLGIFGGRAANGSVTTVESFSYVEVEE